MSGRTVRTQKHPPKGPPRTCPVCTDCPDLARPSPYMGRKWGCPDMSAMPGLPQTHMSKQLGDKLGLGNTAGGEDKVRTFLRTNGVPNFRFALGDALTLKLCKQLGHNISFVCPNHKPLHLLSCPTLLNFSCCRFWMLTLPGGCTRHQMVRGEESRFAWDFSSHSRFVLPCFVAKRINQVLNFVCTQQDFHKKVKMQCRFFFLMR